jgi:hypothetical protein
VRITRLELGQTKLKDRTERLGAQRPEGKNGSGKCNAAPERWPAYWPDLATSLWMRPLLR